MRTLLIVGVPALACVVLANVGATFFAPLSPPSAPADSSALLAWTRALCHWDSGWYARIASDGYWYAPGRQSPVAFFPGYPLVVRALSVSGLDVWTAGVLLSLACGAAAAVLFHRWSSTLAPAQAADAALVTLVLYPAAFFLFGTMYSDALFLLLVIGAFWAVEKDEVALATLLGAASTACRPMAPAVVCGLVARSVERRLRRGERIVARDLAPALAVVGFAAYAGFLWMRFGEPFAFAKVQAAPGWDQLPGWHTWLKVTFIDAFRSGRLEWDEALRLLLNAAAAATGCGLAVVVLRRLGVGYGVYVSLAVGLATVSSKDFVGLGRYLLAAFPVFLVVGQTLQSRRILRRMVWAASAAGLAVCAVQFGRGAYLT
jgi:hypothetical protein